MTAPAGTADTARSLHDWWLRWFPAVALGLASLAILLSMTPHLLLTSSTPTGGDVGAHVFGPAYLRDVLLPQGRIQGWSNSWFAGFPVFYFYFPLPSLFIVAFDLILPYGVAFKLMTVVGLIALAPSVYFMVRSMGLNRLISTAAGVSGAMYVFMENPTPQIFGGTIASTLAGEFSYSWAFALSFVYLGCLFRAVYDGERRYFVWAGAALAATALCHLIPTLMVVVASLIVLLTRLPRIAVVAGTWVLGFALAAFWALPLLARLGFSNDMNWQPLVGWDELLPPELWPMIILGSVGMFLAGRKTVRAFPLIFLTLIPVGAYFFLDQGTKLWNGRVLPHWFFGLFLFSGIAVGWLVVRLITIFPDRFRTVWLFVGLIGTAVVAALAADIGGGALRPEASGWRSFLSLVSVADLLVLVLILGGVAVLWIYRQSLPTGLALSGVAIAVLLLPPFIGTTTGENYVNAWARWNYSGYEGKDKWSEYRGVMTAVASLPPGRVQWEANRELNQYGTPMSLMLFPYWTEGTHPSMEGLFFESSITTPFHFLNAAEMSYRPSNPIPGLRYHNFNFQRGLLHMGLFNVDYYVAFTDEAKAKANDHPGFEPLVEAPPFVVYGLPESSLVDVAIFQPWVFEEEGENLLASLVGLFRPPETQLFSDMALDWYEDTTLLNQWVVEDGPPQWERVGFDLRGTFEAQVGGGEVSQVVLEDHRIAFHTTAVGVPHLVKVSYFPNWQAQGAQGPWRAAPSLMVVIPTQENVELTFERTWVEWAGGGLTLSGLVGLIVVGIVLWGRRSRSSRTGPSPAGTGLDSPEANLVGAMDRSGVPGPLGDPFAAQRPTDLIDTPQGAGHPPHEGRTGRT